MPAGNPNWSTNTRNHLSARAALQARLAKTARRARGAAHPLLGLLLAGALSIAPATATAAESAKWRYAPAQPPPPPAGSAPAPYPVPLGEVGEISFWSPNRGLLITGGTQPAGAVAPGLYAYDGASWHQLSTVCGGGDGRIAWAGPEEFWTISDQRSGQILGRQEGLGAVSLCHFLNGQVVGSYAMPLGQPDSYLQMDAAACLSSDDCWFAGEDGSDGSFHLHWNGSEVSTAYDPEDHAVTGMVSFQNRFYEGLAIAPSDSYLSKENAKHPAVIRTIAPGGGTPLCQASGQPSPFCDVFLFSAGALPEEPSGELPLYTGATAPTSLSGFEVASDGSPLGAGATQLWAAANPIEGEHGRLTILHEQGGSWSQVIPGTGAGSPLAGAELRGSEADEYTSQSASVGDSIAPVPGTKSAWLSLTGPNESAEVAQLEAAHEGPQHEKLPARLVGEPTLLPTSEDPVGYLGQAGPIACPAQNDCWMATSEGWLFHLSDGTQYPQDGDPDFAGVISYRPPDASVPVVYPDEPPLDDSLANQQALPPTSGPPTQAARSPASRRRAKPLLMHVKSRLVHRHVLVISFTLTARAHVQLVGRRKGAVVAKTHTESLRPGAHTLSLSFDPAAWPTKLQFKADPIGSSAPSNGASESGAGNTLST